MKSNLHKLYYKDYFAGIEFGYLLNQEKKEQKASNEIIEKLKKRNEQILSATLFPMEKSASVSETFQLQITYPGLVTGVGISHETSIEGEFKLGVHFDYTYGMPVIYGSSVKGVLRQAFKDEGYIKELIKEQLWPEEKQVISIKDLVQDIFEGKGKSIYNRDVFFDAVIVKANAKKKILASDSITPHGDNPLKNPIPITFLKIASGVTMEFRFKLVSSVINGMEVTGKDKRELFKKILLDFGVGAKTNVGYGQFDDNSKSKNPE